MYNLKFITLDPYSTIRTVVDETLSKNGIDVTRLEIEMELNSIEAINGAQMVCDRLGVHHYTLDHIDSFREHVVNDFTNQYLNQI